MIRDYYVDKLRVRIFENRKKMGTCSGSEMAQHLKKILEEKDVVNMMFAAAPSQNEVLETLRSADIDWSRVNAFHMDEYIGLNPEHSAGFGNFLRRSIFDWVPFRNVYYIDGNAPDPQEECYRYAKLLREYPIDVCMLGVGENGHIAFNDPPVADFQDPEAVKIVKLESRCRRQQVNDGCFASLDEVPTHAITVTIPALCSADGLYCTVPASTKAQAVKAMLQEEISTACPASILRQYDKARLYLDPDAAALL